jgi:hypothetical protein
VKNFLTLNIGDAIMKKVNHRDSTGRLPQMANEKASICVTRIKSMAGTSETPSIRKRGSITSRGGNKNFSGQ